MSKCYECRSEEAGKLCSVCGLCRYCCSHRGLYAEVHRLQVENLVYDQIAQRAIRAEADVSEWRLMYQRASDEGWRLKAEADRLKARVVELEAELKRANALMTPERGRPCG